MKHYMNILIRLRQDCGATEPEYTREEIMAKLVNGTAKFEERVDGEVIFIMDTQKTNKIMGVIETSEENITIHDEGVRGAIPKETKDKIIKDIKSEIMGKVNSTVYLMKDSQGNQSSGTVECTSDTVQICGMHDRDGKCLDFESDAYHIPSWCKDNGIELKILKREEDFDKLWKEAK